MLPTLSSFLPKRELVCPAYRGFCIPSPGSELNRDNNHRSKVVRIINVNRKKKKNVWVISPWDFGIFYYLWKTDKYKNWYLKIGHYHNKNSLKYVAWASGPGPVLGKRRWQSGKMITRSRQQQVIICNKQLEW